MTADCMHVIGSADLDTDCICFHCLFDYYFQPDLAGVNWIKSLSEYIPNCSYSNQIFLSP